MPQNPEWFSLSHYTRNEIHRLPAHRMGPGDMLTLACWAMRSESCDPVVGYPVTIEGVNQNIRRTIIDFVVHSPTGEEEDMHVSSVLMHSKHVSTHNPTQLLVPDGDQELFVIEAYLVDSLRNWDQALADSGLQLPRHSAGE